MEFSSRFKLGMTRIHVIIIKLLSELQSKFLIGRLRKRCARSMSMTWLSSFNIIGLREYLLKDQLYLSIGGVAKVKGQAGVQQWIRRICKGW